MQGASAQDRIVSAVQLGCGLVTSEPSEPTPIMRIHARPGSVTGMLLDPIHVGQRDVWDLRLMVHGGERGRQKTWAPIETSDSGVR